jgi:ATP-dependent Clp protease ATP-binding subunit ClpC
MSPPQPEDFGESGKLVLSHAQAIAAVHLSESVEGVHLFLGVVALEDAVIRRQFMAQALDLEAIAASLRTELADAAADRPSAHVGASAVAALEEAQQVASAMNKPLIEAPHILIGVLRHLDGPVARRLREAGADLEKLDKELWAMISLGRWSGHHYKERRSIQQPGIGTPSEVLESLGRDLTAKARAGELSPIIGRDREMLEVIQVLCGKRKNNAVLIGDAGVGKTAIVEGLAQRIVAGQVPDQLDGMTIRTLEVGSLVAGTMYRGQFEGKLKALIDALRDRRDVILFIDEMHTLIGAGSAEGAPADAADYLKPVLTEGSLKVIGATTTDEFRKHIESDPALMRRFQEVVVGEPSREATLTILDGLRPKYQEFHGVTIENEALAACVDLSVRHMHDRFLPDKALDLLDRACTQEKLGVSMGEWMPALAPKAEAEGSASDTDLVVDAGEIAEVVSIMLEIPIAELTADEKERLLRMGEALKQRVIGQDHAVDAIADTIRAERVRREDPEQEPERPYGVFLFLGPTGVGKTKLAEEVAAYLFTDKDQVIRLDMSEYAEQHTVSGLVGSPPGYAGWEQGGQLTNAVRARPYSVVLLDEVEKAHPEVWNVFLQVFEDGRLTDKAGRLVDFRNTVIIMTSNVGARQIQASRQIGFTLEGADEEELSYEDVLREVNKELTRVFAPEFLNRIDEVLVFRPLSKEALRTILGFLVAEMLPVRVELSDEASAFLLEQSYDPAMGARPARRAIQRLLRNPISLLLLEDKIAHGDTVAVGIRDGTLTFEGAGEPVEAEV